MNLTLKTFLGSISLLGSDHLHETKATRLLGMGIKHDLALLNIAVFLEETGNFNFSETRMDTGDEEVGAWVDSTIILRWTTIVLGRTTGQISDRNEPKESAQVLTDYQHDHCR